MARFRCPPDVSNAGSWSSIKDAQRHLAEMTTLVSIAGPSKQPPSKHPKASHSRSKFERRPRSKTPSDIRSKVDMARKVGSHRSHIRKRGSSHVYVGNLSPKTSEAALRGMFQSVSDATIVHLSLRCSMGTVEISSGKRQQNFYAVVAFEKSSAARKALDLNGRKCDGRVLIVSRSPLDLPEFDVALAGGVRKPETNPVQLAPTVLDLDPEVHPPAPPPTRQAGAARNRFMGVSFGKSVM